MSSSPDYHGTDGHEEIPEIIVRYLVKVNRHLLWMCCSVERGLALEFLVQFLVNQDTVKPEMFNAAHR